MEEIDPVAWVISHNLHRRHLNTSQRATVAAKLATLRSGEKKGDQGRPNGLAQDEAAKLLNVSPRSVKRAKQVLDHGSQELIESVERGEIPVSRAAKTVHVTLNTGEHEWYTPAAVLEKVRVVLGTIDLDPCSCDLAQQNVQASKYYTKTDDGLARQWLGSVYLNPPYDSKTITSFTQKLLTEFQCGNVVSAIVLTNNSTDAEWFHDLTAIASSVCFPKGRIRYLSSAGVAGSPLQGQAIIYLGDDSEKFRAEFESLGTFVEVQS